MPIVFSQFGAKLAAIPEIMVFLHLRPVSVPSVGPENRYSVSRLAIPNCYRLVVRYGFNDVIITPYLASVVKDQIQLYKIQKGSGREKDAATMVSRNNDGTEENSSDDQAQTRAESTGLQKVGTEWGNESASNWPG